MLGDARKAAGQPPIRRHDGVVDAAAVMKAARKSGWLSSVFTPAEGSKAFRALDASVYVDLDLVPSSQDSRLLNALAGSMHFGF